LENSERSDWKILHEMPSESTSCPALLILCSNSNATNRNVIESVVSSKTIEVDINQGCGAGVQSVLYNWSWISSRSEKLLDGGAEVGA